MDLITLMCSALAIGVVGDVVAGGFGHNVGGFCLRIYKLIEGNDYGHKLCGVWCKQ